MANYPYPELQKPSPWYRELTDSVGVECPACLTNMTMFSEYDAKRWFEAHVQRNHPTDTFLKSSPDNYVYACPHCGQGIQITLSKGGIG